MGEWKIDTPWRQGHLLSDEAITALGLRHPRFPNETVVIVASHDCDLTRLPEKEPNVEVIVGHKIPIFDGNNTHAKSSRTLHLEVQDDQPLKAEFVATDKRSLSKERLADYRPLNNKGLSPNDLVTFQQWLASRYRRSAFPNEFEKRMDESGLADKIARIVKPSSAMIEAVLFDVDKGQAIEHSGPDDPYILGITLLYTSEPDSASAEGIALKVKAEIENAFTTKFRDKGSGNWKDIELEYVEVISDNVFSYRQLLTLKKWNLNHISLRVDPQQPIILE